MAREMLGLVMVMGLLLAMVPNTMQRSLTRPDLDGPFVGLILSTSDDESLLLDSGSYVHETSFKKAGRKFNVGSFNGVPVVYVIALSPIAYVSATVQILVENFHITGIIDYGNSGSVNPSLKLGDVAVLSETAFTGAWNWEKHEVLENSAEASELASLRIGDYNVPESGDNKLASLKFENYSKYTPYNGNKNTFWYYIDPKWLQIANQLKDIELESCINGELCAEEVPTIVFGIKGSSSDVYLENAAYGKFLHQNLGISTVDQNSAATVSTAVANKLNHIVFRAASNKPGVPFDSHIDALASKNNLKVVSAFIKLLGLNYKQPLRKYY